MLAGKIKREYLKIVDQFSFIIAAAYQARHLLSVLDQDPTPQSFLASNVINIVLSLVLLMIMVLRGNPKCVKNQKLVLGFKGQLRRAQKKINKVGYS